MRTGVLIITPVVLLVTFCVAQETSLGDVARQSRAEQATRPHAKKVVTDENSAPQPIRPDSDPLDVYKKAWETLVRDTSHRCIQESSGNSGPGWSDRTTTEVNGDRVHVVAEQSRPDVIHNEAILIGSTGYERKGSGPWMRTPDAYVDLYLRFSRRAADFKGPDHATLEYQFNGWDLKVIGHEVVSGVETLAYNFSFHQPDFERAIATYVGINDGRLYKSHMITITRSWGTPPVIWQTTTTCTYGVDARIEPPM